MGERAGGGGRGSRGGGAAGVTGGPLQATGTAYEMLQQDRATYGTAAVDRASRMIAQYPEDFGGATATGRAFERVTASAPSNSHEDQFRAHAQYINSLGSQRAVARYAAVLEGNNWHTEAAYASRRILSMNERGVA